MKKLLLTYVICILQIPVANAQNPVISGQYSADPTAKVFDGKPVYEYEGKDDEIKKIFQTERLEYFIADESIIKY